MRRVGRSALWLLLGVPAGLGAQGFGVYEHGTCTMGRAGVAAANPCNDGSAIFFNPAGLANITGFRVSAGSTLILPSGSFTRDATGFATDAPSQSYLVPNVYLSRGMSDKVGLGFGVYAPYGLGTKWPTDDSFEGRFLGYHTALKSIYFQPTAAYKINDKFQVGLGFAYIHASVELHQRADLSTQVVPSPSVPPGTRFSALGISEGTDFADAGLDASGSGFAINFGAIWRITDKLTIGGRWLTRRTIKFEGTVDFEQIPTGLTLPPGHPFNLPPLCVSTAACQVDNLVAPQFSTALNGALVDGPASTEITLPPQGSIGFSLKANDKWTVMGDYQLVVWGWFNELTLDFENATTPDIVLYEGYRDTHGFRVGVENAFSDKVTFRGGYLYHSAAAPSITVTPLLPEGSRNEFTLGVGLALTSKLHADLAYQYIKQNDRRGRVHEATVGNTGLYTFSAHLLGASVVLTF
jgi:long-chain fatty acid transport protein